MVGHRIWAMCMLEDRVFACQLQVYDDVLDIDVFI